MELIDRDDMIKSLMDRALYDDEGYPILDYEEKMSSVKSFVDSFPTVDAEPVRHGKWIVEYEVKDGRSMRCSECQMVFWVGSGRDGNYCPNCGAKMDGEQEKQEKEKAFWSRYLLKPCAEEEEDQNDQTD